MSQVLIDKYLTELARLRQVGGTHRESVRREAFRELPDRQARVQSFSVDSSKRVGALTSVAH